MPLLPDDLAQQFCAILDRKGLPGQNKANYLKWLRFYWDFCHKYHDDPYSPESLPQFLHKLYEKRQSEPQQKQARHAITLFYRLQSDPASLSSTTSLSAKTFQVNNRVQPYSIAKTIEAAATQPPKPVPQEHRAISNSGPVWTIPAMRISEPAAAGFSSSIC